MVCWLKFLKFVSDALKNLEPNLPKRKRLAIDVLKEIEKERGHNIEKIKETIDKEGEEGMIRRAERIKKEKGAGEGEVEEKEGKEGEIKFKRKKKKIYLQER